MSGLSRMRTEKGDLEQKIFYAIFEFEKSNDVQVKSIKVKTWEGVDRLHIDEVIVDVKL